MPLLKPAEPAWVPTERVLAVLAECCPQIEHEVRSCLDEPLLQYASIPWTSEAPVRESREANAAWNDLIQELRATTVSLGRRAQEALLGQFEATPLIQSGAHCQLLLDRYSFFSNMLFALGARAGTHQYLVSFQSATNTLESSAGKGPAWLNADGHRVNVFGLSRRILRKTSVMGLEGPLKLELSVNHELRPMTQAYLQSLRDRFSAQVFGSAQQGFAAINAALWREWNAEHPTAQIVLDERFAARVLIRHLERGGILSELLSHACGREMLALPLSWVDPEHPAFVPHGTDLIWMFERSRIRPLRLEENQLRGENKTLSLDRHSLIAHLQRGECVPNLFLQFLLISILPRVRVTGGLRQCVYYTLFQRHMLSLAALVGDRALAEDLSDQVLNHWGMRVLEEPWQPLEYLASEPPDAWARLCRHYAGQRFFEATRGLRIFGVDSRWSQLLERRNASRPG